MWIVTDRNANPVAQIEPTRGNNNLSYQLIQLGLMKHRDQLKGLGQYRHIEDERGEKVYFVVKLPYVPVKMRKAGRGVLLKPLDLTPRGEEGYDDDNKPQHQ